MQSKFSLMQEKKDARKHKKLRFDNDERKPLTTCNWKCRNRFLRYRVIFAESCNSKIISTLQRVVRDIQTEILFFRPDLNIVNDSYYSVRISYVKFHHISVIHEDT